MTVGEDKNKIENIVKPNIERFRAIYEPIWKNEQHLFTNGNGLFEQNTNHISKYHHLNLLPKMVQFGLVSARNQDGKYRDTEDIIRTLSYDPECEQLVEDAVAKIVKSSSLTQSIKGIFTAGVSKSTKYSMAKLRKMYNSKPKDK